MNKIILENQEWELIEEYKDGFDENAIKEKYTDYFEPYDYIKDVCSYECRFFVLAKVKNK